MTLDEVTLDRPEVRTGFSVIRRFCRLRLSRFIMKFSAEIFAPYRLVPALQWVLEIRSLPLWQFCCTICYWEYELFSLFVVSTNLSR